jgi:phosphomannomutase/phosphoglucomutase
MKLIFSALAIFSVLMVLIAGIGVSLLTNSTLEESRQESVKTLATSLAYGISSQMLLFEHTVMQIAMDEDVVVAIESGDVALMQASATKMQKFLPLALKIRLLPASVNAVDERETPVMGYADLEMVKQTLTAKQPSIIQGEGVNRHLAVTAAVKHGEQVIGVVLASLKLDFLTEMLTKAPINDNFIEIIQDALVLEASGNSAIKTDNSEKIAIPNSSWQISYVAATPSMLNNMGFSMGLVITLAIFTCIALFLGYYYTTGLLKKDQNTILEAVKHLMTGKELSVSEVKLNEMQIIISTLVQFKRILDNKNSKEAGETATEQTHHLNFDDEEALSSAAEEVVETKKSSSRLKKKIAKPIGEAIPKVKPQLKPEASEKSEPLSPSQSKPQPNVEITATTPMQTETKSIPPLPASSQPAQHGHTDDIFKAYDIRGIVGKSLTKEIVYDVGLALGSEAKVKGVKTVVIARDGRLSSPDLSDVLIKGIISTGRHVLDIGLVPTPVLYFVTQHTEGRTGVMVTGSHNPADYNGLKMVMQGEALAGEKIQHLKNRIEEEDYITEALGTVEQNSDYAEEYVGTICDDVRLDRALKVVVDCGNGAAGKIAPELLKTLGCEVIPLFCEIDGKFPNHHPDPSKPENLKDLIAAVISNKADIGLAFDGDGDRLGVVDSAGKIIWPDRQMMLYAKQVLAIKGGAEIIYDVKCSRHLAVQIRKHGGRPLMWKTGHSLIKAKLRETGASLAGEMSGHIFFNDRWFGFDDALYTAARLLEILSADHRTSSEVFADYPDSINTPELNVSMPEGENFTFMEKLVKKANFPDATIIDIDGLRVEFKDGWGLVRASNTTPSLVLRFEADNEKALEKIQYQIKKLMLEVKDDLHLPF